MTSRPIIDAGPGINFFSINQEGLLIATLGPVSAPEAVQEEVYRKSRCEPRFESAGRVWTKLGPKYMEILSDDATEELADAVARISGLPIEQRMCEGKDLGETMVIAHATVAAEQGHDLLVLIDDGGGRNMAATAAQRLVRRRAAGHSVGSIRLTSTRAVLEKAAGGKYIPDRLAMRRLYERLRGLDDGLVPLDQTGLMELGCWS